MTLFFRRLVWFVAFVPALLALQVIWFFGCLIAIPIVAAIMWTVDGKLEDLGGFCTDFTFFLLVALKKSFPK